MTVRTFEPTKELNNKLSLTAKPTFRTISTATQSTSPYQSTRGGFLAQLESFQALDDYPAEASFNQEIRRARKIFKRLQDSLRQVLARLEKQPKINLGPLLDSNQAFVTSLLRNPDVMLYLTRTESQREPIISFGFRMAAWAVLFGRFLNLRQDVIEDMSVAALLCKAGYMSAPHYILNAKNAPNPQARELLKWSLVKGMESLQRSLSNHPRIIALVGNHQERHDGSGFPKGKSAGDIPLPGQILGVCDHFEALISDDFRATPLPAPEAIRELYGHRGRQFDRPLVEAFIQAIGLYPTGSLVKLNDDRIAIVMSQSTDRLKPKVMIISEPKKNWPLLKRKELNLEKNCAANFIICSIATPPTTEHLWNPEKSNPGLFR